MKKIVLTGGGTAGHVTPNIALLPSLQALGYDISYIGSYDGIEKKLLEDLSIPYYGIDTGKLRRYRSIKNLSDPFHVVHGLNEAYKILKKLKPDVVFSKGGYVSVPVVLAASSLNIPVICHESDMTPGLANKICLPRAWKVCCNFPETAQDLPADKAVVTGTPIRQELFTGDKDAARRFCEFTANKPAILVTGGSLGSANLNEAIRKILPDLLTDFQVVHLCGKGKLDPSLEGTPSYRQYEYISEEMKDLFAMADIIVSRAGANAICEILALKKPNLLIPLSKAVSRGDQILNARSFEAQGFSVVLEEEELNDDLLLGTIHSLYYTKDKYIEAMTATSQANAIRIICDLIEEAAAMHKANPKKRIPRGTKTKKK